ncbi:MAG: Ig-like domain-containing protein [Clostridium sp.]|nr:Ig-like domain-containing protein [Acetatifactor muris]MCM1527645.1 Ig-like domain-containing protein [Bacteroides sp.]MCM1563661.1 Ig-like domain-containing protein [Clostridium sp.]
MKRLFTTCLAVLLMVFLMPATANAASERVTITVTADKTTASPGDTVNFEVKLGAVEDLGGLDFKVVIPEGLTIKPDSIAMQDGLKDILKSDGDIITPSALNNWNWCYSVGAESYTGTSELCILSFACTVNADAAFEGKSVTLDDMVCFDGSLDLNEIAVDIVPGTVTVEKAKVHVSGVTLDRTALTMKDGETAKLTATVQPANADNQNLSWASDNTAVATVAADGTVTAVKAGTATITATAEDGGKKVSCAVTVNCDHSLRKTEAVAAACETDGNVAYWSCDKCGKTYADAAGTGEITNVTIPATGHTTGAWNNDETNHWKKCTVCGKETDKAAHTFQWVVDKAATEDETGLSHEACICGRERSENTVLPKLDHVHTDIRHHQAVAATCTAKGNVEYWTCSGSKCAGKYYGDSACQIAIASIETPIDPENHVYDNDADSDCNLCGFKRFYVVTGGAGAIWEKGSAEGLTFTADGAYKLFLSVEIDGKTVDKANYDTKEGSTIVTLKQKYMTTLSDGTHTLRILFTDGKEASTQFTVQEESEEDVAANGSNANTGLTQKAVSPKTGDVNASGYPAVIVLICAAVIAVALVSKRRLSK